MRASREAKANTMRVWFEAFMESGFGAGEEGERPGEGGAQDELQREDEEAVGEDRR